MCTANDRIKPISKEIECMQTRPGKMLSGFANKWGGGCTGGLLGIYGCSLKKALVVKVDTRVEKRVFCMLTYMSQQEKHLEDTPCVRDCANRKNVN